MKKYILICLVLLSGCCVCKDFTAGMSESWDVIGPRYRNYVEEDPNLTEKSKTRKLDASWTVDRMIYETLKNQDMISSDKTYEQWLEERPDRVKELEELF